MSSELAARQESETAIGDHVRCGEMSCIDRWWKGVGIACCLRKKRNSESRIEIGQKSAAGAQRPCTTPLMWMACRFRDFGEKMDWRHNRDLFMRTGRRLRIKVCPRTNLKMSCASRNDSSEISAGHIKSWAL
jgi:hypothetical protein